jgi:hypothetical protein
MLAVTYKKRTRGVARICTYCGRHCEPRARRDTVCICCCRWFCENCLFEHQRSPEYRNPFVGTPGHQN